MTNGEGNAQQNPIRIKIVLIYAKFKVIVYLWDHLKRRTSGCAPLTASPSLSPCFSLPPSPLTEEWKPCERDNL